MTFTKLISGVAAATLMSSAAIAQTTTIVEPVPEYKSLDDMPVEYNEAGVIKAQHIKPGDISPEDYAKLLEEADRVRAFQSDQGQYTGVSYNEAVNNQTMFEEVITFTPAPSTSYDIQMFDSEQEAVTYAETSAVTEYTSVPVNAAHIVVKGDTLYNISKRFGVTLTDLRNANGLEGNALKLGQALTIPSVTTTVVTEAPAQKTTTLVRNVQPVPVSGVYAVLPGDTMYSIARRACVTVGGITAKNNITDATAIKPGQRLTMPAGHCLN